jgi:amidohydrolase
MDDLARLVADELPVAVELRHRLHAEPRLSGDEDDTAAAVAAAIGVPAERVAATGRLLRIGPATGPAVMLRAELDALPLTEQSRLSWASTSDVMHACGHDVHCAAVVAIARAARNVELPCGLLVVLQPREEQEPSGAADVVEDPVFAAHQPFAAIGVHVQPQLSRGLVGVSPGPVNASSDILDISVTGRGGHGGYPHRTDDPVLAMAHVVTALHTLVSRRVDPMAAAVLTVGEVHAGTAPNIIPEVARARASLRALDPNNRVLLHEAARRTVTHVAASFGCTGQLDVIEANPMLVNDPALSRAAATQLPSGLLPAEFRSCGADDFAFYSAAMPTLMLFVGTDDGTPGAPGLHHPLYVPSDDVIAEVASAYLAGFRAAVDLEPQYQEARVNVTCVTPLDEDVASTR